MKNILLVDPGPFLGSGLVVLVLHTIKGKACQYSVVPRARTLSIDRLSRLETPILCCGPLFVDNPMFGEAKGNWGPG